jgi:hypothetical protein
MRCLAIICGVAIVSAASAALADVTPNSLDGLTCQVVSSSFQRKQQFAFSGGKSVQTESGTLVHEGRPVSVKDGMFQWGRFTKGRLEGNKLTAIYDDYVHKTIGEVVMNCER